MKIDKANKRDKKRRQSKFKDEYDWTYLHFNNPSRETKKRIKDNK